MTSEPGRVLELREFVLLVCQFEITGEVADSIADVAGSDQGSDDVDGVADGEPDDEVDLAAFAIAVPGARVRVARLSEEGDEFVLILDAWLTDPTSPYELRLITGSSFTIPEPRVTTEEVASTLLFITYPYLRELVFSITSRSPYQGFSLPPITRLPHPRVLGQADGE